MSHLLNQLKSNVLVADGAIGTIFYSEGLDTCPESYNLTHPDKVERIHRSYIEAGQTSFKRIRMVLTLKN